MGALKTHFLNLYSMALADSSFAEKELEAFYHIAERHGIEKADVDFIILNPSKVSFKVPTSVDEKVEYLYDYAKMILADDKVEAEEISTFEKFCVKFEFELENISTIRELLFEAAKNNVPTSELINFVHKTN